MGTSPVGIGNQVRGWGLTLEASTDWRPPETEQECLEYYQDKIVNGQNRQLYPLQEDLADWINKTLGIDHITATNLLDVLDNGVILCHLAKIIHDKAEEAIKSGTATGPVPNIKGPFFEKASRRSFFSRDNMDKFIQFCKQLGVHQNLLFETNDLVQQNQPRNVVLCLMEVARIASRYNVEPPGLVALEKEIAEEESREMSRTWQMSTPMNTIRHSNSATLCENASDLRGLFVAEGGCGVGESLRRAVSDRVSGTRSAGPAVRQSDTARSDSTDDDWSREIDRLDSPTLPHLRLNELDIKVKDVTRDAEKQCRCANPNCEKLKVRKIGEGKYNIAGRNVFVRLLKGRHMMVRVGGGWDTLENFLARHDPCQMQRPVSRPSTPGPGKSGPRPYSALSSPYGLTSTPQTHSLAR